MNKVTNYSMQTILILLISLCMQFLLANEQSNNENTSLHKARSNLSIAFDKYKDGDIAAAKQNLKQASEWLQKATAHSKSEKVKIEAKKLASEIDSFHSTLKHSSEQQQNAMARFWHRATSLIKRESEHLMHSYTASLNDNKTMKHLLNAKMQFYVADHDLFVSHNSDEARVELNDSIDNLVKAKKIARPELKSHIQDLINNIKTLIALTESNKDSWKKDQIVHALDKAINNLTNAEKSATPATILRLKLLEKDLNLLKSDIKKAGIKTKYDAITTDLNSIIKNI